jgi:leader peptidase (prepilin peptidase)/N-methyltransferase
MSLLEYFQSNTGYFLFAVCLFGLAIGSFLNVVIHRLPIILEREWREECQEFTDNEYEAGKGKTSQEKLGLAFPGSRCPRCGHKITALENIPVISYLLLRGKCSECSAPISMRYPLIEVLTAVLSVLTAWYFGVTLQTLFALFLTWSLIALAFIDIDHQILPDKIVLPMLWLGLLISLLPVFVDSHTSIIGSAAGYLSLWLVYKVFKAITGKEGMGYGDFKLLAMLGAWMGWTALPAIIILSSLVGAVIGLSIIAICGRDKDIPIPFGPYLAAAGWIQLIYGDVILQGYLQWAGLS